MSYYCIKTAGLAVILSVSQYFLVPVSSSFACGGILDALCNLQNGGLSPGNIQTQVQKAGQDVANALNELQAGAVTGPALQQAIVASRNTAINGAMPIPPDMRAQLTGYASEDSMNRVRYKIGDPGFVNLARLLEQEGLASAVTLIDVIIFRGPSEAADPALWAHELTHVDQYQAWGVQNFAVSYARDARSVENPAYDKQNGYWPWRQQEDSQASGAGAVVAQGLAYHAMGTSMVPAGWAGCLPGYGFVQVCTGQPNPADAQAGTWAVTAQSCQ
jgi:hypothetical protein